MLSLAPRITSGCSLDFWMLALYHPQFSFILDKGVCTVRAIFGPPKSKSLHLEKSCLKLHLNISIYKLKYYKYNQPLWRYVIFAEYLSIQMKQK